MAATEPDEATIFHAARRMEDPEARGLYLRQACAGDDALKARVEALLRVHQQEPDFLAAPPHSVRAGTGNGAAEKPGTEVGPYKLLEQIGEGGFGVVFLAEQRRPLRRSVALKILKPGMDTKQVVARFEAERQALALMDHPNIARVLDGGQTATGRPFFVMELVKGLPITRYCDEQALTGRQRLGLFVTVCEAVQHAHQKGIIHRDIKPTNVLVAAYDGKPVVKVIDFGVAKALDQQLTERTLVTSFGGVIGTLEYMSPEQAEFNARDVDTRADIYSLGVLLYELLTGTTPLTRERLAKADVSEALRLIREEDPPKPSARLSGARITPAQVSAQRKLEPRLVGSEVRGELDWIVMKALDKDRDRRYSTANSLARDVERYLHEEPVEACPPSATYKLRKFARKNRKLLLAAAAFVALLAAATAVSAALAVWAAVAEHTANRERDRADAEAKQSRRNLYAAHMNLAQAAWEEDRVGRLVALLDRHRLTPGEEDLRGFEWYYWRRLADSALLTLTGHRSRIVSVAFSPDGKRLASASHDRTVRVWDVATGRETHTLTGHEALVIGVAFSPDGRLLASAGGDKTVKLWDPETGKCRRTLAGHTKWVAKVAFRPDGRRLASAGHDGKVKVWDLDSGRAVLTLSSDPELVHQVVFSPDGTRLASANKDRRIKLWDAATGAMLRELAGHTGEVVDVAFSPDGTRLASASLDRTVRVWDLSTGQSREPLKGHRERVFGVAFSPDGTRVASASFDQTVKQWDAATGEELGTLKGHGGWVACVAFSPNGNVLASAGDDRTIKLWDARAGQDAMIRVQEHGAVLGVAFSPDGRRFASAGNDSRVSVWDAASGQRAQRLRGHSGTVYGVAFSPDGTRLATAGGDGIVRLWDAEGGREIRHWNTSAGRVRGVAFSPDGLRLASADDTKTITVWDADTGRPVQTFEGQTGPHPAVAFSADGQWLASGGGQDHTVRLWELHEPRRARVLQGHAPSINGVTCVTFSRDGTRLASASGDRLVKVWDLATGRELLTLAGHTDWVAGAAFSPDGKRLASASADKTIKLWDLTSGQETLTIKGHSSLVLAVAFSPDGRRLLSGDLEGVVGLSDARPWTRELRVEQEARSLVGRLITDIGLKAEVNRAIEQDSSLSPEVQATALEMVRPCEEDENALEGASWRVVQSGGATPGRYALALRQAEAAYRLKPDDWFFVHTLAAALYRNGKLPESVEALTRSDKLYAAGRGGHHPYNLAVLAMAQFKLGRPDQARATLAELGQLLKQPKWSSFRADEDFFGEAAELIEGKR